MLFHACSMLFHVVRYFSILFQKVEHLQITLWRFRSRSLERSLGPSSFDRLLGRSLARSIPRPGKIRNKPEDRNKSVTTIGYSIWDRLQSSHHVRVSLDLMATRPLSQLIALIMIRLQKLRGSGKLPRSLSCGSNKYVLPLKPDRASGLW